MLRPADLQQRLEVSPSTLRLWSNTFADFLSPSARPSTTENGGPSQRRFTEQDLAVLVTVKQLLAAGLTYDRIKEELTTKPPAELAAAAASEAPTSLAPIPVRELSESLVALANLAEIQLQALRQLGDLVELQKQQAAFQKQQMELLHRQYEAADADRQTLTTMVSYQQQHQEDLQALLVEIRTPWYKRLFSQ